MKKQTSIALAAAALLAGISVASAAPVNHATMAPPARDTLNLTSAQQKLAWDNLYTGALNQKAPAGFTATIGAVVPHGVTSAPVTAKAASDVPALKPYKFAMVQRKLVIINPNDRKIAEVITR